MEPRNDDRWTPNDASRETLADTLRWQPDAAVASLVIEIRTYFDRVVGATTWAFLIRESLTRNSPRKR